MRSLVKVLKSIATQLAELTGPHRAAHARAARRSVDDVLPARRSASAAQILAELVHVRERLPSADRLASEAGAVLVTYQSGKTRSVAFRWACNHLLQER